MRSEAPPHELALLLHAHLPDVRCALEETLEEGWLFEAITECYLPLVACLESLDRDEVPGAITLSISPPLLRMLRDPGLAPRFEKYFSKRVALVERCRVDLGPAFRPAAEAHALRLRAAAITWTELAGDIPAAFARLSRSGRLSLWTCADPHPLLPLWSDRRWFLDAAIGRAISLHRSVFGAPPGGLWLPECAVSEGVSEALAAQGVACTVVEAHGLLHGTPRPRAGVGRPVRSSSGVFFFGRDPHTAARVWSRDEGYPGHAAYQDFYAELPGADRRARTGVGLLAVTDRRGGPKRPYDPARASETVRAHARAFIDEVRGRASGTVTVAPFDAELFGHWWAEGVEFLSAALREAATRGARCVALDRSISLQRNDIETISVAAGSWGRGGHLGAWIDGPAAPMARALEGMARALESAGVSGCPQALEALLSASASDWPFLLNGGGAPHYAQRRFDASREAFWRALRSEVARRPRRAQQASRTPHTGPRS